MSLFARTLLVALAACSTGCVTATLERERVLREPVGVYTLVEGEDDLEDCLELLGAPLFVRENGPGAWLAWGWAERGGWSVTGSVPISDTNNLSLRYGRGTQGLEGAVLFFDHDWTLVAKRRGYLTEIMPPAQVRAQIVE